MHILCATRIGGYIYLQHCSSGWGGGHRFFDHQIGGSQNIAEVLPEIYDPPIPKKMVAPLHLYNGGTRKTCGTFIRYIE